MTSLGVSVVLLAGCSSAVTPITGCDAADGIVPICGFRNPEDIVATPSGEWLLVSERAEAGGRVAGSIAAYARDGGRIEVLFPVGEFEDVRDWGDPDCAPPPIEQFAPRAIDLDVRRDGALQLLVVNRGGRDSVEFLDVERSDDGLGLHWRGCVRAPDAATLGDVVARSDGGFWVTDVMPGNRRWWSLLTGELFGANTGRVYRWTGDAGFVAEAGSAMPLPDAIEKAPDEAALYVASADGSIRRLDLERGDVTAVAAVARPDRITWSPDGKLLVASQTDSFVERRRCREVPLGACGSAFEIVSLDPQSMAQFVILAHRGAPIGGASVALRIADEVYLGAVAGDRIARWHVVGTTP
jgi:sugar lactone lactonase YvrE